MTPAADRRLSVEPSSLRSLLLVALLCLCAGFAWPQSPVPVFDATALRQPADLDATWLVHGGDDPAYAQPGFDDSHWARFNSRTDLRNLFGNAHPEVVWYRLHVKVAPTQSGLALQEWSIARAYEIYVNGQLLMHAGHIKPFSSFTILARLVQPIPDAQIATGSLIIALRVHIARAEWTTGFPGLYYYNLSLGQQSALRQQAWLTVIGQNAATWLIDVVGLGLGIVALALFYAQRSHREYLWIFLSYLANACLLPLDAYQYFHDLPAYWRLMREPLVLAYIFFSALMYLAFLKVPIGRRIGALLAFAVVGLTAALSLEAQGNVSTFALFITQIPTIFLFAGVLPFLMVVHWRRGNREAGILLIPSLLGSLSIYANILIAVLMSIPATSSVGLRATALSNLQAGPFTLGLGQISNLLDVLALALIIVLRATRISRQQALVESELAAARAVQQVILPDQIEAIPGFSIESVYLPAQQVGGDFFQILPVANGGLLLVIGDVAGKGLPAAMLVSVLVGAIRGVAEYTTDPAELLANLNQRLVGRANGAFSTALAIRVDADGTATIANAGHLSPYLDGREIDLPGALPLGIQSGTLYPSTRFSLTAGSRLTFYSDGVVEAQNRTQELFGFDRSRALSTHPAAEAAQTAQAFGQQDDITVVSITRDQVAELVPA